MKHLIAATCLSALLNVSIHGQIATFKAGRAGQTADGLEQELDLYTITDQTMMDGLSALSLTRGIELNLGIEEVLRKRINSPMDRSHLISLRLEHATVQEVLNALCNSERRYTWSVDGSSINVFPAARAGDSTDLLNFYVGKVDLLTMFPIPTRRLLP